MEKEKEHHESRDLENRLSASWGAKQPLLLLRSRLELVV